MTNNTSHLYSQDGSLSYSASIFLMILLGLAVIITILGNLFTMFLILRNSALHTEFNYLIFNLAAVDLLIGALIMPCFAAYNYFGTWPLGDPLCSLWVYLDWLLTVESLFTMSSISVERFVSISWPIAFRRYSSPKSTLYVIAGSWAISFLLWTPVFVTDKIYYVSDSASCNWDPIHDIIAGHFVLYVGFIIPCTIMIGAYVLTGLKLLAKRMKIRPEGVDVQNARKSTHKETSALSILGWLVLAYCLCWFPFYAYYFTALYSTKELPEELQIAGYWLGYLNSTCNSFLNLFLHQEFRKRFFACVRGSLFTN